MKLNFDNFTLLVTKNEAIPFSDPTVTAGFDVEGLDGITLIQVKRAVLIKFIESEGLNKVHDVDKEITVDSVNYFIDYRDVVTKLYISSIFK